MGEAALRGRREALFVVGVSLSALAFAACTETTSPSTAPTLDTGSVSIAQSLTSDAICGDPIRELIAAALPGADLDPQPDTTAIGCAAFAGVESVGITVSYGLADIGERRDAYEKFAGESELAQQQCPGGASFPVIEVGLRESAALICSRDEAVNFEFVGVSPSGVVVVRVGRAASAGAVTDAEALQWTQAAITALTNAEPAPLGSAEVESTSTGSLEAPSDEYNYCEILWRESRIEEWAVEQGLDYDSEPPSPTWTPDGPTGDAIACAKDGILISVTDATDSSTADSLQNQLLDLNEVFPDVETAAELDGATGESSILTADSGSLASVDLRKELRLVYVQVTSDVQLDTRAAYEFLSTVGAVAFALDLPTT